MNPNTLPRFNPRNYERFIAERHVAERVNASTQTVRRMHDLLCGIRDSCNRRLYPESLVRQMRAARSAKESARGSTPRRGG
jgi:hypothetical protein